MVSRVEMNRKIACFVETTSPDQSHLVMDQLAREQISMPTVVCGIVLIQERFYD